MKAKPKKTKIKKPVENLPAVVEKTAPVAIDAQSLIAQAISQKVPVEVLEKIFELQKRVQEESAKVAFREAMSRFQAEIPIVKKNKPVYNSAAKGGGLRYKYAPVEHIAKVVQPFLEKNGLSYTIDTKNVEGGVEASVTAHHVLGHSGEPSRFTAPIDTEAYMNEPQKWEGAQTLAKRVAFCNAFGILTGDEDNNTESIKAKELKAEEIEKKKAKLETLSEDIKTGLRIAKYGIEAAYLFCEKYFWDEAEILRQINIKVDTQK